MIENKKLLFVVNVDWFFISHRLPIALKSIENGYEVHIACGITDKKEYLESLGLIIHPVNISRGGMGIVSEVKTFFSIYKVLKNVQADIVHFITIKPVLYGGIASRILNIKNRVFSISGLGYIFVTDGFKNKIIRSFVKLLYKFALDGAESKIIVQNKDDKNVILDLNVCDEKQITLIRGSGVDLNLYKYEEEKNRTPIVVMASRLLKDKGVFEFIEAVNILKNRNIDAVFHLYGDMDENNRATLTIQDLEKIKKNKNIEIYGFSSNIEKIFRDSNIVVLPSYREGLPKVLIEAAACGRAVITTDVAGCRDAIENGKTGLLVEVKNSNALADAIEKLINNKKLRINMGKEGRKLAEKEFSIETVVKIHLAIYKSYGDN